MVPPMGAPRHQGETDNHPAEESPGVDESIPGGDGGALSPTKTVMYVDDLTPTERYKLATSLIVPRPVGWIGSLSADGVANLAPYSFFNVMAGNPPVLVFAPGTAARKDTLVNVRETGEFTVNVVTEEVAEAMNRTSADFPPEVDEFGACGLTAVPAHRVAPPLVGEARANFECLVTSLVPVGDPESGGVLVIGEAVAIHVEASLLDGTRVDQEALHAIGRHAGNTYSRTRDQFEMERPTGPTSPG